MQGVIRNLMKESIGQAKKNEVLGEEEEEDDVIRHQDVKECKKKICDTTGSKD